MSKQPSNQAKKSLLRRGLAGILALALILGLLPASIVTAHAAHWADSYVETLVDWGVMRGDINGNMAPERSITRAEFVAMMNRAYGYTNLGGHPFTDVTPRDWYDEDIDIGYNIGYFKGTSPTTASPNDTLTREQAAVLLSRNMMLQPTVGETLGFSDSRALSDWSRGLVGAAASNGIIGGYDDGSFQPSKEITRGEVAAMLVRAIGTPINTEGEHALGNVYGNVTVNTAGVKLRDGVIVGNLYLTGGIDLGDVLLENVTVLGDIVVSGGGESNSSAASIIMRNVEADNMIVDSISDQFVTIRAEGVTDIPFTTVRTNAYVDDSSLPGYGLSYIELDGEEGTLLQLAGNVKEVWNKTPGSNLQVVQGSADKVTMDEKAVNSTVLVDGDAQVGELNLDVATTVTGTGDIKHLNVGAAGSTVEQLPDEIYIRPGITTDIAGTTMNNAQGAESSAAPRILAGYPAVRKIAPNSAELVFRTNKPGTIYWAVSAVADGSVKEGDLLEPPVYGGNVIASGTIKVDKSNTDYTASVTQLLSGGSYYVTAMLVDGRDQRSPVKVTSFSTPDDTVPAFNQGYPYMSRITTENSQVTVSTNKSCLLYYALLPKGSTAPTPAEFKANAISGNLGYGTIDAVKNVTQPFQVNSTRLQELTEYTLYLWLTDYDGAKSSRVYSLNFKTPDEQPPVIVSAEQTGANATAVQVTFSINEPATLFWAIVPDRQEEEIRFEDIDADDYKRDEILEPNDRRLQIKIENGAGNSIKSGSKAVRAAFTNGQVTLAETRGLDPTLYSTHSFTMYLVAKDEAGNYSKVQKIHVKVLDEDPPTVKLEFNPENEQNPMMPSVTATARLVFSEKVKGNDRSDELYELYQRVDSSEGYEKADAMSAFGAALARYIVLYRGAAGPTAASDRNPVTPVATAASYNESNSSFQYGVMESGRFVPVTDWQVNYCAATVTMDRDGQMVIEFPAYREDTGAGALKLSSGTTYHFTVTDIIDESERGNMLKPNPTRLEFTTSAAQVLLTVGDEQKIGSTKDDKWGPVGPSGNDSARIDYNFRMNPIDVDKVDDSQYWDMLIWFDANVSISLYSRQIDADGNPIGGPNAEWEFEGSTDIGINSFKSLMGNFPTAKTATTVEYMRVNTMLNNPGKIYEREYAIHVDKLEGDDKYTGWNQDVTMRVSVVSGTRNQLSSVMQGTERTYDSFTQTGGYSIETPTPFTMTKQFSDRQLPNIQGLTISIADTSANVNLYLDRPGMVYYLVIPLDSLNRTIDGKTEPVGSVELTEGVIKDVTSYSVPLQVTDKATESKPPLPLVEIPLISGDPDRVQYTSNKDALQLRDGLPISEPPFNLFTGNQRFDDLGVIKGQTGWAQASGERLFIDLENQLQANTVYFLCLLPSGQSTVPDSNSPIVCYRFTTNLIEIPKLELTAPENPNVTANVGTGNNALMDYFLVREGQEPSDFDILFYDPDSNNHLAIKEEEFKDYLKRAPEVDDLVKDKSKGFTVLDAMATKVYNGKEFLGTVFDLYAEDSVKPRYADLVRSTSAAGGTGRVIKGGSDVKLSPSTILPFDQNTEAGQTYTVVAIARKNETSDDYAFAALYPLRKENTDPPKVLTVTANVKDRSVDATGKQTGIGSATITLTFDDYLYRFVDNDAQPICGCGKDGVVNVHAPYKEGGSYPIGHASSSASTVIQIKGNKPDEHKEGPIRSIELEVTGLLGNRENTSENTRGGVPLTLDQYIIVGGDVHGTTTKRDPLVITVRAVNQNPLYVEELDYSQLYDPDIPNGYPTIRVPQDPYYELEVTINREWAGGSSVKVTPGT